MFQQSGKQNASSPIDADTVTKKRKPHVSDTDEMEIIVQSDHDSVGVPGTGDFVWGSLGDNSCALHGPSINKSDNHSFFKVETVV